MVIWLYQRIQQRGLGLHQRSSRQSERRANTRSETCARRSDAEADIERNRQQRQPKIARLICDLWRTVPPRILNPEANPVLLLH